MQQEEGGLGLMGSSNTSGLGGGDISSMMISSEDHHNRNLNHYNQLKSEIATHPLYEQLLSAHVACLRVATPIDQLPLIDAQLTQSHNLLRSYASSQQQQQQHSLSHHERQELDNFLVILFVIYFFNFVCKSEMAIVLNFFNFFFLQQAQYLLVLCSFKEQLQQHVRVHAVEAVMACREIEQNLQLLTGMFINFFFF